MKYCASQPPFKAIALATCVLAFSDSVNAFVIDEFSEGQLLLNPANQIPSGVTVVQTNLNLDAVIGGTRQVYLAGAPASKFEVNSMTGLCSFENADGFGYFDLVYGSEAPLAMDLSADGSDAFLLSFSDVYTPGSTRGTFYFYVDGVPYYLREEFYALNGGAGTIRIPFSQFGNGDTFVVNTIDFGAIRVEPTHSFVLDSIITVPEPNMRLLLLLSVPLIWMRGKHNQPVETNAPRGWQRP